MTSAPVYPNGVSSLQGARFSRTHGILFWVAITMSAALLVSVLVFVAIWQLTRSLSNIDVVPIVESGGTSSWMANNVARADHLSDGALTLPLLDEQWSNVEWLPAGSSVPTSGSTTYVSVSLGPDDIVTAVATAGCEYGLTVTNGSDPAIAKYGLPGPGTYAVPPGPRSQPCSATSAPLTGWQPIDRDALHSFGTPTKRH